MQVQYVVQQTLFIGYNWSHHWMIYLLSDERISSETNAVQCDVEREANR
jgi:hypothetical protein